MLFGAGPYFVKDLAFTSNFIAKKKCKIKPKPLFYWQTV